MAISRETYTNIAKLVREFFEEIGLLPVHELPDCKILRKRLMGKDLANHTVSSTDLVGVCENESVLFGYYDSQKPVATLLEDIAECHTMEDTVETVHVVVFAEPIQEILALNKEKNKLVKKVRACMPLCQKQADTTGSTVKAPSVKFYTMHVPQWGENIATIDIESRICALHHGYMHKVPNEAAQKNSEAQQVKIESDVYIARLYDIVELYNGIGAPLFDRNVRYHIKDSFDVETEIHKTLRNNPSAFFHFNNGISMQIKNADNLDKRHEGDIRIAYKDCEDISVINGAQTITAAAEFFYQPLPDFGKDEEIKEAKAAIDRAKKEAKVLLRVIYPEETKSKKYLSAFDQISIALNRQKPIKAIDVYYACMEVMRIHSLYEQNRQDPFYFRLLKRGASRSGQLQYQLAEFGRLVWAYYYNKPGKARTASAQPIVQHDEKNHIYAPFKEDDKDVDVFMQWYRPINFANEIGNRFEEAEKAYSKGDKCDKNVTAVLAYGRYYFIAFTVKSLNPQMDLTQEEPDFSQFPYWADHAKKLDTDMILRFAKLVAALAGDVQLDSNHFKKEEFYSQWCTYAETSEEAQQWLADCKNALGEKTLISPLG